jgi:hypothetical protein
MGQLGGVSPTKKWGDEEETREGKAECQNMMDWAWPSIVAVC